MTCQHHFRHCYSTELPRLVASCLFTEDVFICLLSDGKQAKQEIIPLPGMYKFVICTYVLVMCSVSTVMVSELNQINFLVNAL